MYRFVFLSLLISLCSCCSSKKESPCARFYEDGRAKPLVALPSVIDATSSDLSWNLSEELTSLLVKQISSSGSICIASGEDLVVTENPFSADCTWMKREFPEHEFVSFLELAQHEFVPEEKTDIPFETGTNLRMAVRLRVVDLRGTTPRIVLQELIRDSYYIPKTSLPVDYRVVVWGDTEYPKSPMGIAHAQLMQEVANRIRDYLNLAKTR